MDVCYQDFSLRSTWVPETGGPQWGKNYLGSHLDSGPLFIIEQETGKKYLNQRKTLLRIKLAMVLVTSPVMQILALIRKVFARAVDFLQALTFRAKNSICANIKHANQSLLLIIAMPLIYLAIELSALYGLFCPLAGRKLYASFERLAGSETFVAPCFQPNPTDHYFGGAIDDPLAF